MNAYPISRAPIVQAIVEATPDVSGDIPSLFLPPDSRDVVFPPNYFWDASRAAPYDRLPRFLVLTVSWWKGAPRGWEPPKFHYGWRPDVLKMLDYAEVHGLMVTYAADESSLDLQYPNILRPQPRDKRCLNIVCIDGRGLKVVPKPYTEMLWPAVDPSRSPEDFRYEVDVYGTLRAVFRKLMHEAWEAGILGQWCLETDIVLTLRADEGSNFVVSVLNSHRHLTQWDKEDILRPTWAEMNRLAEILGASGRPQWYVDRDMCQWLCDSPRPPACTL